MATRFAFRSFGNESLDREAAAARLALMLPALLATVMLVAGLSIGRFAGIESGGLFAPYFIGAAAFTVLSLLFYIFVAFCRLAGKLAENPVASVWTDLRKKAPLLLLPVIIYPVFLTGFTTTKCSIPIVVGYRWEVFWADADTALFGRDAWEISHALLGAKYGRYLDFFYSTAWVPVLMLFKSNVAIWATPRRAGIIFTAMMLTWIIGGWLGAYAMSAAGPVFAHLFDPALADRFAPMHLALEAIMPADSTTRLTQAYLVETLSQSGAVKGGGISAMPSMHIGAATIYILAARGTKWLLPAIGFWAIIFLGSAYFGYHYWVDGVVAALIALVCWRIAEIWFRERPKFPQIVRARLAKSRTF